MKTQLKRLLALNLAIILLLCAVFPASAAGVVVPQPQQAAAEPARIQASTAAAPGTHTLTVNGQTCMVGAQTVKGSGWEACAYLNGDNAPLLVLTLQNYNGGAIKIENPTDTGDAESVYALIRFNGTNRVSAAADAGLTVSGYSMLRIESDQTTASLTICGKPAVRAGCGVLLAAQNITLDGLNGPAYEAEWLNNSGSMCSMTEERQDGVVVRVTTGEPTPITVTIHKDEEKTETVTVVGKKYSRIDLTSIFTQTKQYVKYYKDARGRQYGPLLSVGSDLELTAVWEPCDAEVPVVFYVNGENFAEAKIADASKDGWTAPEQTGYTVDTSDGTQEFHFLCWEHQTDGTYTYLLPGQAQPAQPTGAGYYGQYTTATTGIAFFGNGETFSGGSAVLVTKDEFQTVSWISASGKTLIGWNTEPDGTGTSYAAYNADVPAAHNSLVRLYAQWLETGSVPVKLYNYVDYNQEISPAKIGSSYVFPEPSETPDGLRFTQWRCYYRDQNGRYQQIGMIAAGESLTVTEDMKEINAVARWLPTGKLTVDGEDYTVDEEHDYFSASGWSATFNNESGRFRVSLKDYQGGSIFVPCLADVYARGSENRIDGTLSCAGTLSLTEDCRYGTHSSLTITAAEADKPAILTNKLTLERVPHMTLTGGENSKAIAGLNGEWESDIGTNCAHFYGRTSRDAAETSVSKGEIGSMWQLRTEPVMCTMTVDGNGGTTADGAASITLQLEYGEGYNLRSAGFKKQYADLIGAEDSTGYSYGMTIWCYPQRTFTLTWKELGYPYIAFRGITILKGDDVPGDSSVAYFRNSDTLTVPKLSYATVVSYGDLVYWYTSENGTETADSRCYLPGETVQEPDDTTLYAASINPGEVALVATGTTFKNWSRIKRAERCLQLVSEDGRVVESWNTKPDGSGTRYEIGTHAILIKDSPRVLYAQWKSAFTASASTDSATGETTLTIQSSSDLIEPPRNTDDKPFEQSVRVILAAYQNGRFVRMVYAEARDGVIRCKLPRGLDYRNCELRLFFLEGGKPSRAPENIQIEA